MSFGSPTPIEVAVQGPTCGQNRAFAAEDQARRLAKVALLRDLQYAQPLDYPTVQRRHRSRTRRAVRVDHGRRRAFAGGGDLFQPVHRAELLARPASGNAFQIQVRDPAEPDEFERRRRANLAGHAERAADHSWSDVARLSYGTMLGEVDRYNMQRVVSLTANIHGPTLGEAAPLGRRARHRARRNAAARGRRVSSAGRSRRLKRR